MPRLCWAAGSTSSSTRVKSPPRTRRSTTITDEQCVFVYYGTGDSGLSTAGSKTIQVQVIDVIGATDVYGTTAKASGWGDVKAEQLLTPDPDWIIAMPGRVRRTWRE